MAVQHEYASIEEHILAMEARMEAIFIAEEEACMSSIQISPEEMAQF